MKTKLDRTLRVFGFDGLQNLITLFNLLEREGISIEEVREFVASSERVIEIDREKMKKKTLAMRKLWEKNTRRCPTCMKPLVVRPINIPKGKRNVKGYTCHWYCQEENCDFEEYTFENYKKVYEKIMEGR